MHNYINTNFLICTEDMHCYLYDIGYISIILSVIGRKPNQRQVN